MSVCAGLCMVASALVPCSCCHACEPGVMLYEQQVVIAMVCVTAWCCSSVSIAGGHLHEEPGDAQVQEVPGVSTRAASRWRVQGAHLSHAFYVVPSSPTSIDSVGRRGAISGTSGAGSASWLGGGLANRVCPGSQGGASPLAQCRCAGRGMAGGEGSGAFLLPTLE